MTDTTIKIFPYLKGETAGNVVFPYKGYEISLSTVKPNETTVFHNRASSLALFTYPGTDIESLDFAMKFIDTMV